VLKPLLHAGFLATEPWKTRLNQTGDICIPGLCRRTPRSSSTADIHADGPDRPRARWTLPLSPARLRPHLDHQPGKENPAQPFRGMTDCTPIIKAEDGEAMDKSFAVGRRAPGMDATVAS